jgi:hypothetical protein
VKLWWYFSLSILLMDILLEGENTWFNSRLEWPKYVERLDNRETPQNNLETTRPLDAGWKQASKYKRHDHRLRGLWCFAKKFAMTTSNGRPGTFYDDWYSSPYRIKRQVESVRFGCDATPTYFKLRKIVYQTVWWLSRWSVLEFYGRTQVTI